MNISAKFGSNLFCGYQKKNEHFCQVWFKSVLTRRFFDQSEHQPCWISDKKDENVKFP